MNRTAAFIVFVAPATVLAAGGELPYPVVDTGQVRCYDDRTEIAFPAPGTARWGQDACYAGNVPAYRKNVDGTVTDRVTGLTWQKSPGDKKTLREALAGARDGWRVPTIKELYSLILFSGTDPDPRAGDAARFRPFIDTRYFDFRYGDAAKGERIIDSQYGTRTRYVSTTMGGNATMFGVNFADGRIKGYPLKDPRRGGDRKYYFIYVKGNPAYGNNDFADNGDGTVTDRATGLTWTAVDSGRLKAGPHKNGTMDWAAALRWAETLVYAGRDDWRLPNAKELQSIVDYTRAPRKTGTPAIDPVFTLTAIRDAGGGKDWPFYWTSTTHAGRDRADTAAYIAFGEGLGWMQDRRTGRRRLLDVHGAGCQRSDPKTGDPKRFPHGRGPQGDVIRITNYVLCVRGGTAEPRTSGPAIQMHYRAPRSHDEGPDGGGSRAGERFVRRLDRDGDNTVSRREFDGPLHHFRRLDRNGDGYLTAGEAPSGPPPGPRRR